ncbi:MAG TPA: hypothetical protein ENH82_10230 [bacterium]|nr:hypothetical protein [bacterium]
MEKANHEDMNYRERRYQWIINIMLILIGFLAGIFFESERMKAQVVTNTVEIRILKENLRDINNKLTVLISERGTNN